MLFCSVLETFCLDYTQGKARLFRLSIIGLTFILVSVLTENARKAVRYIDLVSVVVKGLITLLTILSRSESCDGGQVSS